MLAFENISKAFRDTYAVRDISLSVPAGAFMALIGPSGSGKTTLLRIANRLIEPSAGQVRIGGADVRDRPAYALRRTIGFVPQGAGLFPHLTVFDNVAAAPRLLGWSKSEIADRVAELLTLVRLDPAVYAQRKPRGLSGGQRQRVAFARALAGRPSLVLLDEPFSALDPETREALQDDLRAIHADLELTTVMVTHDMAEALILADRIAVLRAGRLVQEGPTGELVAAPVDDEVARMLDTPRRQARAIRTALAEAAP